MGVYFLYTGEQGFHCSNRAEAVGSAGGGDEGGFEARQGLLPIVALQHGLTLENGEGVEGFIEGVQVKSQAGGG